MELARPLRIGITCYPSVGGSGILASALGEELARRGHEVHFISYERPFRLPADAAARCTSTRWRSTTTGCSSTPTTRCPCR